MSDLNPDPTGPPPRDASSPIFAAPAHSPSSFPRLPVLAAFAVILLALAVIFLGGRKHHPVPAGTILPLDPQASTLPLAGLVMSESTSLSGGKSTFIDGHIRNAGNQTVTAVTVQVLFRNDLNMPPQVETLPLTLIRARQPYIDTQPVAAAPLAPGEERDFRLIFENINNNWNVNLPEVHITSVATR